MKVPLIIVCLIVQNNNVGYETQKNDKYIFFDDKLNVQIDSLSLFCCCFCFKGYLQSCSIKQKRCGDTFVIVRFVCKLWNVKGD